MPTNCHPSTRRYSRINHNIIIIDSDDCSKLPPKVLNPLQENITVSNWNFCIRLSRIIEEYIYIYMHLFTREYGGSYDLTVSTLFKVRSSWRNPLSRTEWEGSVRCHCRRHCRSRWIACSHAFSKIHNCVYSFSYLCVLFLRDRSTLQTFIRYTLSLQHSYKRIYNTWPRFAWCKSTSLLRLGRKCRRQFSHPTRYRSDAQV